MQSKLFPTAMDARVDGGHSKAQSQRQVPTSLSNLGIKAQGTQDLSGQATTPKKSQWLRLFAYT